MTSILFAIGTAIACMAPMQTTNNGKSETAPMHLTAQDLAGGYTISGGEKHGASIPQERLNNTTVRFTEDRVVVYDRDEKEVYGATYQLHPDRTPCRISMVSKLSDSENQQAEGLIEKDGDTVRLIYALPGGETPKEFKTSEQQLMFVLTNQYK